MIDVTDIDLKEFVKEVYNMSVPMGLGILYYNPDPMTDEQAENLIEMFHDDDGIAVSMGYVQGRQCKMVVLKDDEGKMWIHDEWYDHTPEQFETLKARVGIK